MHTWWEYEQHSESGPARDWAVIVTPFIDIGVALLAMWWCDPCCRCCFVFAIVGAYAVLAVVRVLVMVGLCCVTSLNVCCG